MARYIFTPHTAAEWRDSAAWYYMTSAVPAYVQTPSGRWSRVTGCWDDAGRVRFRTRLGSFEVDRDTVVVARQDSRDPGRVVFIPR